MKMNLPLVTVYITNYNYEKFIKQAVESVLNQSFQNFELLIIDDGSTDNSKDIIESYAPDPKIRVVYQQNKGLNITNNIALQLASGKYIMRLDADDYLIAEALEKMVKVLQSDDDLGLVFPDYYLVDSENNITAEIKRHDFGKDVKLLDQPAHGACTMIRTDFLREVGGYDESYSCQDGYELWIKFVTKFKVANINEPLFFYRQHGANLTSNEERILNTRRLIKDNYILKNEIQKLKTVGIIPVRKGWLGKHRIAFLKLGEENLLDMKIKTLMQSKGLNKIAVTSEDAEIEEHVNRNYSDHDNIVFVKRPQEIARFNVSLNDTINLVLNHSKLKAENFEAFMILPIEFPFLPANSVDEAINTLAIFNADSVISVRIERASLYQHHGEGMFPIMNRENFTRLEREALYKGVGGITLTIVSSFKKTEKLLSGKVGHVVVDEKTAHEISSLYNYEIAKFLATGKTQPV